MILLRQARAKEKMDRTLAWANRRPRALLWAGLALTLWLALFSTRTYIVMTPSGVEEALNRKDDIPNLYYAAVRASWSDIPKWWVGPWNYPDVGYYRPLSSMLYFFEQRAFDKNFTAYNIVTWCLHGLNAVLLFLFTASLFPHHPRARYLLGLVAVYFFTTMANSLYYGVARALEWWPAQNDVLSLTFALLSLLLLDRHLQTPRRRWPVGALLAFAASVGTKEMGFIVLPLALVLIWHRASGFRWRVLGLRQMPLRFPLPDTRYAPTIAFLGLGVSLWMFRRLVIPNAWGPDMYRLVILKKGLFHWTGPFYSLWQTGTWWPIAASAAIAALVLVGLRRRWPVYRIAALGLLAAGLCAEHVGPYGTWALLIEPQGLVRLGETLVFLLGVALFWRYRREEPGPLVGLALLLVYLPILQYGGRHYFYWPGAFLGLVNATFCACLWRWGRELRSVANWSLPTSLRASSRTR